MGDGCAGFGAGLAAAVVGVTGAIVGVAVADGIGGGGIEPLGGPYWIIGRIGG